MFPMSQLEGEGERRRGSYSSNPIRQVLDSIHGHVNLSIKASNINSYGHTMPAVITVSFQTGLGK